MLASILLNPKAIVATALVAIMLGTNLFSYTKGRRDVLHKIQLEQAEGKIKILKQTIESDSVVDNADDPALCAILGGCELPDDESSN